MTPLRFTRRHALGRRIGAAGPSTDCVTVAPGLATPDWAMPDDIGFTTDWIMPPPPPEGAGRAPIPGRS